MRKRYKPTGTIYVVEFVYHPCAPVGPEREKAALQARENLYQRAQKNGADPRRMYIIETLNADELAEEIENVRLRTKDPIPTSKRLMIALRTQQQFLEAMVGFCRSETYVGNHLLQWSPNADTLNERLHTFFMRGESGKLDEHYNLVCHGKISGTLDFEASRLVRTINNTYDLAGTHVIKKDTTF